MFWALALFSSNGLACFGRCGALGVCAAAEKSAAGGAGFEVGAERDRPIRPSPARVGGDCAVPGGFPLDPSPAVVAGPDRAAAVSA